MEWLTHCGNSVSLLIPVVLVPPRRISGSLSGLTSGEACQGSLFTTAPTHQSRLHKGRGALSCLCQCEGDLEVIPHHNCWTMQAEEPGISKWAHAQNGKWPADRATNTAETKGNATILWYIDSLKARQAAGPAQSQTDPASGSRCRGRKRHLEPQYG